MSDEEHLTTGWEPDVPPTDTVNRAAIDNHVALVTHPGHGSSRTLLDDEIAAGDAGSPSLFLNAGLLRRPALDAEDPVLEKADAFYREGAGGPGALFSPWPTPDLTSRGWQLAGHPPLMVLPPGATAPEPPPGLSLVPVGEGADADDFGRVLVEGYPIDDLLPYQPGSFFTADAFTDEMRGWVGYEEDRPVTAAMGLAQADVVGVHFVATLAEARGKRYGEAATWAATMPTPDRPSILLASDLGRPIYERMGYLAVTRWALWIIPRD